MMKKEKTQPAYETRLNHIRLTVWENTTNDGKRWFNSSVTRRYQEGNDWKDSTTFNGLADLVLVAEAIRLAQEFIRRAEQEHVPSVNE
jgi:hypothetical protein